MAEWYGKGKGKSEGEGAKKEGMHERHMRERGEAQKIIQDAGGYKDKTIAEATGVAAQFISVLDAYKAARDVTARRMYIETMEAILSHSRKIIIDPNADGKNGVVPYLPLPGLTPPAPATPAKVQ